MLSTLQHITKITEELQTHFAQSLQVNDPNHSSLHALLTSVLNNLMNCAAMINAQAPISRLSMDVLSLVLQEVHYNEIETSRHPLSRARFRNVPQLYFQSPLLLSHVSRLWHDVTLNLPLLWTTIEFFPSRNLSLIDIFLSRSKSCPIFLNIMDYADPEFGWQLDDYRINKLYEMLVPHISRCRSILICAEGFSTSMHDTLLSRLRDQGAPLLEWFFLHFPRLNHSPVPQPIFTFGAPMLSYIHLSRASILFHRPPFHHVVTLHLDAKNLDFAQCAAVASQCPLLETLAIYGDTAGDVEEESLVLPRLHSLELYGEMGDVSHVLLAISAPSLESLVIAPIDLRDLSRLYNEANLYPKRYASVKSLTLTPYGTRLGASLQLASECFPNVVDVTLIGRRHALLIESLQNTGPLIFPNMRSLALRNLGPSLQRIENILCSLCAFRSSRDRPIRTLYLDKASLWISSSRRLHDAVDIVELDKWSNPRRGGYFCDENDAMFCPL